MPKQIPIATIVSASIKGVCNAQRDYSKWSGGHWLWRAPEYLSGTYIAQEIARVAGKQGPWYLTMENSARKAMRDAGGMGKGRPHSKIRSKGRFDLLLWWGKDEPRAPIEVKRQVTQFKHIRADIERLEGVIHRKKSGMSFQFGASVFYTSTSASTGKAARSTIEKRIVTIVRGVKDLVKRDTRVHVERSKVRVEDEEHSAWAVVAIILQPARST